MCRITINLTRTNDDRLRKLNRKKGDLSKIINTSLDKYFQETEEKQKKEAEEK